MPKSLTIGTSEIRLHDGLYSLNDLHKAAGGEAKHEPNQFMRLDQTQALIEEISNSADLRNYIPSKTQRGKHGGTYVCRELVYAYAMWISPKFNLQVIRAFDALTSGQPTLEQVTDSLTPSEQQTLKEIVKRKVGAMPVENQGKAFAEVWSRLQNKFRVAKYDQLPRSQLTDAILYITTMEMRSAPVTKQEEAPLLAQETLDGRDMNNITRLVWIITRNKNCSTAWVKAIWYRLRRITGTPAPHRMQVRHLPVIAEELRRIFNMAQSFSKVVTDAEKAMIRRVLRDEAAELEIMPEAKQIIEDVAKREESEFLQRMESWNELTLSRLVGRQDESKLLAGMMMPA